MLNTDNSSLLIAAAPTESSTSSDFTPLAAGVYTGVLCGLTVHAMPDYNDSTKTVNKVQFVFHIAANGEQYFVRSKPMKISLYDQAPMYQLINKWMPQLDLSQGLALPNLLGAQAMLVTSRVKSKDGTREYAQLENVLPAAQQVKINPAELPSYMAKNAVTTALHAGYKFAEPKAAAQAAPAPQQAPQMAPAPKQMDDDNLPF